MLSRGRVTQLSIRNFRSIAKARLHLSDLTILVGPNGAGKSNVLDALRFAGGGGRRRAGDRSVVDRRRRIAARRADAAGEPCLPRCPHEVLDQPEAKRVRGGSAGSKGNADYR